VLARLLAELISGGSRNCAVYSRQRRCGVELADGGAAFQAGWMLLAALSPLSCEVYGPLWAAWLCRQTMLLQPDEQSNDVTPSCNEQ